MRVTAVLCSLVAAAVACSSDDQPLTDDPISISTPSFVLQPGEEKFYCFYTKLPTSRPTAVRRMASRMPPGSHHMIVFKTTTEQAPDGTFAECENFGMGSGDGIANIPVWLYASQETENEIIFPDGVGMALAAAQPVIVNMHYVNQTEAPITAEVDVELEPYSAGANVTEAHAYITFNTQIDVAPGAIGEAGGTCDVDPASNFIMMSTHSHQYTMKAQVFDGASTVLETLDWAHATVNRYEDPYYQFGSGKLDYRCQYRNTSDQPLRTGESAIANEMCMAVGVYFPARGDTFCLNSFTITL